MADNLITLTDARYIYGATAKDMAAIEPTRRYFSRRNKCWVTLFSIPAIETYLVERYGSLEACVELAKNRRAAAQVYADKRRQDNLAVALLPPSGWPSVGRLRGLERWAAVDVETTGLETLDGCRVVEVAAVIVEDGVVVQEWCSRINPGPGTNWDDGAILVHGITPADVETAPAAAEVWREFGELTAGLVLVAHNADFDGRFVRAELDREGISPAWAGWFCTMRAATRGDGRWQRLGDLYWQMSRRYIDAAHSAMADAKAVAWLAPRVIH